MLRRLKIKDLPTVLSLFLTVYALSLATRGRFELSGFIIILNLTVLDLLDGFIARLTNSMNEFGKHLDSVIDFVISSVYVPLIVYFKLKPYREDLAVLVSFFVVLTGVLRETRSRVEDVKHSHYFLGYPRTYCAILIVACINSSLIRLDYGPYWVSAVIVAGSLLNLSYWPYVGNNKKQKGVLQQLGPLRTVFMIILFAILGAFAYLGYFWDGGFYLFAMVSLHPLYGVDRQVWREVRAQVKALRPS